MYAPFWDGSAVSEACCQTSEDLTVVQSCSCNDAVLNSADLIDWDEDSIQCGAWVPHSPETSMHHRCLQTSLCMLPQLPQQHNCVVSCSCKGHTGLRCLRPWKEPVQSMRELGARETSQRMNLERLYCLHASRPHGITCCTSKVTYICPYNSSGRGKKDCSVLIARGEARQKTGL